jgi:hypothetical protein
MRPNKAKAGLLLLSGLLALGLLTLAWAIGPGSSEAEQDAMHNCPQPGKWAISVWDGPDGTDTGQALDTCGAGSVDAAYHLDPQTQGWSRWFAGQPGLTTLATVNNKQGVIALGAMGAPPPSPTPSPAPTATPGGQYSFTFGSSYGEPDTFRGVVEEIRMMDSIPGGDLWSTVTPPTGGQFAVVLVTVTNIGNEGASVGSFSFRLRDGQARLFTMDFSEAWSADWAAEAYFDRQGLYETVMPGITLDMVFVFLVPEGTTGLVAERCPDSGC